MKPVKGRIGELRPTQILFSYGVGALVDLPYLTTMVMGLDDWNTLDANTVVEERLLAAVRRKLGPQIQKLYAPPQVPDSAEILNPFEDAANVGVPVAPFPRWMVCPYCRLLAPISLGLFELKTEFYRPDRARYVHRYCSKKGASPAVFPARFLVACKSGHLDEFPWVFFVHRGSSSCQGPLRLLEAGPSGEARDVRVDCQKCQARRRMAQAFGEAGLAVLPRCRGRRLHLRDAEEEPCSEPLRTILIGASNIWFPANLSVLSIPSSQHEVEQLIDAAWSDYLEHVSSVEELALLLKTPPLKKLARHPLEEVWEAVKGRREPPAVDESKVVDLKVPEWAVFSEPSSAPTSPEFRLREVEPPSELSQWLERVVLVERLREVRALTGFSRIESPGALGEPGEEAEVKIAPLCRGKPKWVPATEVRGEGLFVQFREEAMAEWSGRGGRLQDRAEEFLTAHVQWRKRRGIQSPAEGFPGLRYILIHSFSHALMRQLSLECGYGAASLRERLYARGPDQEGGPMAGLLLYTAAPGSEGTLGGLVSLGEPEELGRLIRGALEDMALCASDPLCSEHLPSKEGRTLHGAACHACLFASETSCERGNRYLDRSFLVETVENTDMALFRMESLAAG